MSKFTILLEDINGSITHWNKEGFDDLTEAKAVFGYISKIEKERGITAYLGIKDADDIIPKSKIPSLFFPESIRTFGPLPVQTTVPISPGLVSTDRSFK